MHKGFWGGLFSFLYSLVSGDSVIPIVVADAAAAADDDAVYGTGLSCDQTGPGDRFHSDSVVAQLCSSSSC